MDVSLPCHQRKACIHRHYGSSCAAVCVQFRFVTHLAYAASLTEGADCAHVALVARSEGRGVEGGGRVQRDTMMGPHVSGLQLVAVAKQGKELRWAALTHSCLQLKQPAGHLLENDQAMTKPLRMLCLSNFTLMLWPQCPCISFSRQPDQS